VRKLSPPLIECDPAQAVKGLNMKHTKTSSIHMHIKSAMAAASFACLFVLPQAHAGGGGYAAPAAAASSASAPSSEAKPDSPAFKNFGDEGQEGDRPNDGVHFIAAWTAMSEICQEQHPELKTLLKGFWAKKFGEKGEATMAQLQSTQRYKDKYTQSMATLLKKRDDVLQQCELLLRGTAH
jgi:hypothetical protein